MTCVFTESSPARLSSLAFPSSSSSSITCSGYVKWTRTHFSFTSSSPPLKSNYLRKMHGSGTGKKPILSGLYQNHHHNQLISVDQENPIHDINQWWRTTRQLTWTTPQLTYMIQNLMALRSSGASSWPPLTVRACCWAAAACRWWFKAH